MNGRAGGAHISRQFVIEAFRQIKINGCISDIVANDMRTADMVCVCVCVCVCVRLDGERYVCVQNPFSSL